MTMPDLIYSRYKRARRRAWLAIALFILSPYSFAQSHSDLLFVVHADGQSYTAQQTLFADDELMVVQLPQNRLSLRTVFAGPGSALYRRSYTQDPNKLTLASGNVFTRFQHRFVPPDPDRQPSRVVVSEPGESDTGGEAVTILRASIERLDMSMAKVGSLIYRVSWLLPDNINLLGYGADQKSHDDPRTIWEVSDRLVSVELTGRIPESLYIDYELLSKVVEPLDTTQACLESLGPSEWCSPDTDNDGVPDYRDVCIETVSTKLTEANTHTTSDVLSDQVVEGMSLGANVPMQNKNQLGCSDESAIVLQQVNFKSDQTYLGVTARLELDKVAVALQRMPDRLFRIAAHTDNVGNLENNQQLSENRANAIRHYLMLRGVGPNQVQARGYGESRPAHDNATPAGRRANRRIELQVLN